MWMSVQIKDAAGRFPRKAGEDKQRSEGWNTVLSLQGVAEFPKGKGAPKVATQDHHSLAALPPFDPTGTQRSTKSLPGRGNWKEKRNWENKPSAPTSWFSQGQSFPSPNTLLPRLRPQPDRADPAQSTPGPCPANSASTAQSRSTLLPKRGPNRRNTTHGREFQQGYEFHQMPTVKA